MLAGLRRLPLRASFRNSTISVITSVPRIISSSVPSRKMNVLEASNAQNVGPTPGSSMEPPAKQAKLDAAEPALLVQRISDKASLPKRGSAKAAGYDIAR